VLAGAFSQESDTSGQGVGPFVHTFCPSAASPVPGEVPRAPITIAARTWDAPAWQCLRFRPTGPLRCQYEYSSNGATGMSARAAVTVRCDPDGDGKLIVATLVVRGDGSGGLVRESKEFEGGTPRTTPTSGSTNVAVLATERYTRRVCACRDADCVKAESEVFTRQAERLKDAKGTEEDAHAIEGATKRAMDCIVRIMKISTSRKP
jgi:hypothetical protein